MYRFGNEGRFLRVQRELGRLAHGPEVLRRGGPWSCSSDPPKWSDLSERVAAARWDRHGDRDLVLACARSLDRHAALAELDQNRGDVEATRRGIEPCTEVAESTVAGLGVFASTDLKEGRVLAEYGGPTLHGAEADALTVVQERQHVWESQAAREAGATGGDGRDAHALAAREAYRKVLGATGGDGRTLLIFGEHGEKHYECGAMVNDGAALLFVDARAYRAASLAAANVAMVARGSAVFCVASRDIAKGEELFYPYGTTWWLGHARSDLIDSLAVSLCSGDDDEYPKAEAILLEMQSAASIGDDRVFAGRSGFSRRSEVAPFPELPLGAFQYKLLERVLRLQNGLAEPTGDSDAGTQTMSPTEQTRRMPKITKKDFEDFRASLPTSGSRDSAASFSFST